MTIAGADYAFTHPNLPAIQAAGITFVCRYLSTDPAKNITPAEVTALHAAGISICLVWETTGTDALSGYQTGLRDAKDARTQATALGFATSKPIYYAVDWDVTAAQIPAVLDYLHGTSDAEGSKSLAGPYGGLAVIAAAGDAGYTFLWQTYAWSGGRWDPRATVRQTLNGQEIGGASVDLDEAMVADYGQWAPGAGAPAGSAPPWPGRQLHLTEPHMTGADVHTYQTQLTKRGWNLGPTGADSDFGPITSAKTLAFQKDSTAHGWPLAEDSECGEHTWAAAFERPISH